MRILGISAFYHDSAAVLLEDGRIVAAAQEERFCRRKHYAGFPRQAVRFCLLQGGLRPSDLDLVAFYEKPFCKFERLLETYLAFAPRGLGSFAAAMPVWLKEKLFQKRLLRERLSELDPAVDWSARLLFTEHHLAHAASAFYPSPHDRSLILVMDGVGEWATTSVMRGDGAVIEPLREIRFPHSLGLLYSAFTCFTGFKVNGDEYKLMGLAPYGEPAYANLIREHLIDIRDDGSFRMDMQYFNYCTGLTMTSQRFERLFGRPPRVPGSAITRSDMDLASSVQAVTEEIVMKMARHTRAEYGLEKLCLAGGVALNSVVNGKLVAAGGFDDVWIQPAAGDAGGALGAALAVHHLHCGNPRLVFRGRDAMQGAYLGPCYSDDRIQAVLDRLGVEYQYCGSEDELLDRAARALAAGRVVGWFQGRMEFGPRALGARSILADPRFPRMQRVINGRIKFRESFRPFAPAVLREDVADYFEFDGDSPYMQLVVPIRPSRRRALTEQEMTIRGLARIEVPRSDIPAVTHVDYTARIQTVTRDTHGLFYRLIQRFKALTGYGLLINTSFNTRGEPIVCSPEDAYRCFADTALDELYLGRYRLVKGSAKGE